MYMKIVPSWSDQLLSQLLMKKLNTLPTQCIHIEISNQIKSNKFIQHKTFTAMFIAYKQNKHENITFRHITQHKYRYIMYV